MEPNQNLEEEIEIEKVVITENEVFDYKKTKNSIFNGIILSAIPSPFLLVLGFAFSCFPVSCDDLGEIISNIFLCVLAVNFIIVLPFFSFIYLFSKKEKTLVYSQKIISFYSKMVLIIFILGIFLKILFPRS